METLHPGVYVQEVPSGVRPIEGVSTSTAAFIGKAEKGPLDRALMVTSFVEFEATYGSFLSDAFLAQAALMFFNNGGKRLYVVRVAKNAAVANLVIADRQGTPKATLTVSASSPGAWGNTVDVTVKDGTLDAGNEFAISVSQGGPVLETFDNLSMNPDAANFVDTRVAGSRFIRAVADQTNDTTNKATSVSGVSVTDLSAITAAERAFMINLNGDGPQKVVAAGATGAAIAQSIQTAVQALLPLRGSTPAATYTGFTAAFDGGTGKYTLTSGQGGKRSSVQVTDSSGGKAAALLKLGVSNGGIETGGAAVLRPANGTYHVGDDTVAGSVLQVQPGSDGTTPQDVDHQQGFTLLDRRRDVNIVAVPGIGSKAVVDFGTNYCTQRGDCFFVGDMSASDDTKEEAQTFVTALTVKRSYGAVYFPWLQATDPSGASPDPILLPPSGYVAGMYASIDSRRGVWKAPAGTEANLGGAVGLTKEITDVEQDTLNPMGVNVIRAFPASGIVIWGARTLSTQSDPEYRYVPVRRTAIFIEQSIYNGIQWAVFEPNDEPLWAALRLNIGAFMLRLYRAGAFQGDTPAKAFFVKCDGQTTTQQDIDAGVVNILVGFAPLKPAEFVVLKLTQMAGQSS